MSRAGTHDTTTIEGLRRFLDRAAALRGCSAVSGTSGLRHFLDQASPFLRTPPEPRSSRPTRSPPEPGHFSAVILRLREPLQRAREDGAFLSAWAVAGLRRNELRNAAVLAWLLDPRGSHGFDAAVLRAFLEEVMKGTPDWPDLERDFSRVAVRTEEWPLGSETDRVDIALDGPDFALFVEVKIDAPEGPEQLRRYADLARRKAAALGRAYGRVIYLSSRLPQDPPREVAVVTWREVARILSALPRGGINGALARQFAHHVRAFF